MYKSTQRLRESKSWIIPTILGKFVYCTPLLKGKARPLPLHFSHEITRLRVLCEVYNEDKFQGTSQRKNKTKPTVMSMSHVQDPMHLTVWNLSLSYPSLRPPSFHMQSSPLDAVTLPCQYPIINSMMRISQPQFRAGPTFLWSHITVCAIVPQVKLM